MMIGRALGLCPAQLKVSDRDPPPKKKGQGSTAPPPPSFIGSQAPNIYSTITKYNPMHLTQPQGSVHATGGSRWGRVRGLGGRPAARRGAGRETPTGVGWWLVYRW